MTGCAGPGGSRDEVASALVMLTVQGQVREEVNHALSSFHA